MRRTLFLSFLVAAMAAGAAAQAQDMPSGLALDEGDSPMSTSSPFTGTMTQGDEFAFRRWFDNARMLNRRADANDKSDAAALAQKMNLMCAPADAALVGIQRDSDDVRIVGKVYEVTCGNGVGYLLVSQDRGGSFAMTCFAVDAARAEAADQRRAVACTLAGNADVKTMAAAALKQRGVDCVPRGVHWIGEGTKSKLDFTEVACTDDKGYVIASPEPDAQSPLTVMNCDQAAPRGIPCTLTKVAAVITLDTFKEALSRNHVDCDASQMRVVGKENSGNRHVVEFLCAAQHRDLVAFIPLDDGTKPFETLDCTDAARRGISCRLGSTN